MFDSLIKSKIDSYKNKKLLIVSIGNDLRGDDGVAPYILNQLKPSSKISLINAGEKIENHVEDIISTNPEKILFLDAADFGGKPGEMRLTTIDNISEYTLSTHRFPVKMAAGIIEQDTGIKIDFLIFQIKETALGSKMSDEVKMSADIAAKMLGDLVKISGEDI